MGMRSFWRTFFASAMISGPMPSPGKTATFISKVPGVLGFAPGLESGDLLGVAQRQADLVEPVEQAVLAKTGDVEMERLRAIGGGHGLRVQVHHQAKARKRRAFVKQTVDLGGRQHHRQEAVLERVVEEDVG